MRLYTMIAVMVAAAGVAGCSDDAASGDAAGGNAAGGDAAGGAAVSGDAAGGDAAVRYQVSATPNAVVPQVATDLVFTVSDTAGAPVAAAVSAVADNGTDVLDFGPLNEVSAGVYTAPAVVFPSEEVWTLDVRVDGPSGLASVDLALTVTCRGDGLQGALCCGTGDCSADHQCVANSCLEASCDDGLRNGIEDGVDCGGQCDRACVPTLGFGTHDFSRVAMTEIATAADGLDIPRDVAINPDVPSQLWVVNRTETAVVLFDYATPEQRSERFGGPQYNSTHFFAQPSAFAFGGPGEMATIHETASRTQASAAVDFMGPTLQDTAIPGFDAGHGSHLDMLHHSPLGMGIAWERDRIYWVFDGYNSAITWYDFGETHGRGGDDHSDGAIRRYVEGAVLRVADVPSHMEFDHASSLLYIADTGNNRVAILDSTSGYEVEGSFLAPYDSYDQLRVDGAVITTLVDGAAIGMVHPSGLAIDGDVLYVSDNNTARIWAFDKVSGAVLDHLDTGMTPGGVMGLEVGPLGELYFVDALANSVIRLIAR